jgi:hypothetical protein
MIHYLTADEHRALRWAAEVMEDRGLDGQAGILRKLAQRGFLPPEPKCVHCGLERGFIVHLPTKQIPGTHEFTPAKPQEG